MKTRFFFLYAIVPLLLISCEGSRSRRMIDAYGDAYEEYENTGDPTTLIIMIVAGLILGGLWLWIKSNDKK